MGKIVLNVMVGDYNRFMRPVVVIPLAIMFGFVSIALFFKPQRNTKINLHYGIQIRRFGRMMRWHQHSTQCLQSPAWLI
jgi:hypothetical protein